MDPEVKIEREATDDKLTEMAKSEFNGQVSAQVRIEANPKPCAQYCTVYAVDTGMQSWCQTVAL